MADLTKGAQIPIHTPVHPAVSAETIAMKNVNFSTHRLQVSNLPMNITTAELNSVFTGNTSITLKKSKRKGAKAVVTFNVPEDCQNSFEATRRLSLKGHPVVVSPKLRSDNE